MEAAQLFGTDRQQIVDFDTGTFTFEDLPTGNYYVHVEALGTVSYVKTIAWDGSPVGNSLLGPTVTLTSGESRVLDIRLQAGATISGTALGVGGVAISGLHTYATNVSTSLSYVGQANSTTGYYWISRLPAGTYTVTASDPSPVWDGGPGVGPDGETTFVLAEGETKSGIDVEIPHSTTISGTIFASDGTTASPVYTVVTAIPVGGGASRTTGSNSTTGAFAFMGGLVAGTYVICADPTAGHSGGCYGGATAETATPVTVTTHQVVDTIEIVLLPTPEITTGEITGTVTYEQDGVQNANGAEAELWLDDAGHFELVATDSTDEGQFEFHSIEPGTYVVRIDAAGVTNGYSQLIQLNSEYWDDARFAWEADPIEITAGSAIDLDFSLEGRSIWVDRVTGDDRFGTSVEVAQMIFRTEDVPIDGIPVVYLANGLNYPDALAAGPAAIHNGGVVLLTLPWSLPFVVEAELERLRPQRIVVVGGEPSVNASVEALLTDLSFDPEVVRITGLDRFGTSREIAEGTFLDGADVAFIATGLNYPDALAAGPPAGMLGAPILLVNGTASTLDQATEDILADLGVTQVYVIGGTPSVSAGIYTRLQTLFGSSAVTRLTGSDRFGTAIAISQEFYAEAEIALLATGLNFPDALAGGPAAGFFGGPLYLSRQDCVPAPVVDDIFDVRANGLVLLGGPPSLSTNVENGVTCG